MVPAAAGVNSSMEEYAPPQSGACYPNTASRRASAGTNRLVPQRSKRCADAQFAQPWVRVSFYRVSRYTHRKGRGRIRPAKLLFVEVGLPYSARPRFSHMGRTRVT